MSAARPMIRPLRANATRNRLPNGPLLVAPVTLLFALLLIVPMALVGVLSLQGFDAASGGMLDVYSWHNYAQIVADPYYHEIFLRTFGLALSVTAGTIVLGVPEAWFIFRMSARWRAFFLILTLGPLFISAVVRTLGWSILLDGQGVVARLLVGLHLVDAAPQMLFSFPAVVIVLVHALVPLMVLSVWTSLQSIDPQIANAAISLGAGPLTVWRRIVLPQTAPGILSGSLIVFALSASAFATPALIGGRRLKVVATAAYDEFLHSMNWPMGAAIALCLLVLNLGVIALYSRVIERRVKRRLGEAAS
ncbi:ABC transporter permease [Paraburkholderia sp.]|uniref:ABC transporter permease n=1 Tax=Paraburkholderia sp. TaxID=1926495 RepID=UPI0039E2DF42